ncbi:MAG TPA: phosphoribosyltransferase [Cytophagales bacterium]
MQKTPLSFLEISRRLRALPLPEVDLVLGIATGGTVPASLAAHQLGCDMLLVHVNYRDEGNVPRYPAPVLFTLPPLPEGRRRILLVDDVSVSGKTMAAVLPLLAGHEVITLVMKGKADYVLFPEVRTCVQWPWQVEGREGDGADRPVLNS